MSDPDRSPGDPSDQPDLDRERILRLSRGLRGGKNPGDFWEEELDPDSPAFQRIKENYFDALAEYRRHRLRMLLAWGFHGFICIGWSVVSLYGLISGEMTDDIGPFFAQIALVVPALAFYMSLSRYGCGFLMGIMVGFAAIVITFWWVPMASIVGIVHIAACVVGSTTAPKYRDAKKSLARFDGLNIEDDREVEF